MCVPRARSVSTLDSHARAPPFVANVSPLEICLPSWKYRAWNRPLGSLRIDPNGRVDINVPLRAMCSRHVQGTTNPSARDSYGTRGPRNGQ